MKRKGFTLVELLAVIIILSIIIVIAVPKILDVIESAKKGAAIDSAYGYIKAVEYEIGLSNLKNEKKYEDGKYDVEELKVNLKGKYPVYGEIELKNKNIIYANMCINDYMVTYDNGNIKAFDKCTGKYDKTGPILILGTISGTTNSLTIPFIVQDNESKILETKCYYGTDENYEKVGTVEEDECKLTGLKNNTTYYYKIEATNAGGITSNKIGEATTGNFEEVEISVDTADWSQSKKVTITGSASGAKLQYRILVNNGEETAVKVDWTDYTEPLIIDWESTEEKPTRIDARLFDGENESEWASLTLTKIATTPVCNLKINTYTLKSVSVETNCATPVGIKEYHYSIDGSQYISSTNNKYTLNSIHISTLKVKVIDQVENTVELNLTEEEMKRVYSGILVLAEEKINLLENNTFLNKYPVGSIYITTSTDENTVEKVISKYGGTWEAYGTDRVLKGTTSTSGQTGGSSTATLSASNIPSHAHSIPALSGTAANTGSGYTISHTCPARTTTAPSKVETISGYYSGASTSQSTNSSYFYYVRQSTTSTSGSISSDIFTISKEHTHTFSDYYLNSLSGVQSHNHSVTTTASNTGSNGSGQSFSTSDPYITVYMYKRIS